MKVLIITYYWPPAGGSGVQRWLKFVKYLQDFGITPVVYTVENPEYPTTDTSLSNEIPDGIDVLKQPIKDPQKIVTSLFGKKTQSNFGNYPHKGFLTWIRGNLFIPDPKIFWIRPSVSFLKKYLSNNDIDVIISTGPPHSVHLIAKRLKRATNISWIADFRDSWTELYYYSDFKMCNLAKKWNKELENSVLKNANVVLTVSNSLKEELIAFSNSVKVITNGYDDEVFVKKNITLDKKNSISHIGLFPKESNPIILWKVLQEICSVNNEFANNLEIKITGSVSKEVLDSIKQYSLLKHTKKNGYVEHNIAIEFQQKAQVLLLLIPKTKNAKGIITGKIFEYLQAKRPILAIGPTDGDLADILKETNGGIIIDFDDEKKLKETILKFYSDFKNNRLVVTSKNIEQYHRRSLTEKLSKIIKEISN